MPECQLHRMEGEEDSPEKVEISFSEIDSIPPISLNLAISKVFSLPSSTIATACDSFSKARCVSQGSESG